MAFFARTMRLIVICLLVLVFIEGCRHHRRRGVHAAAFTPAVIETIVAAPVEAPKEEPAAAEYPSVPSPDIVVTEKTLDDYRDELLRQEAEAPEPEPDPVFSPEPKTNHWASLAPTIKRAEQKPCCPDCICTGNCCCEYEGQCLFKYFDSYGVDKITVSTTAGDMRAYQRPKGKTLSLTRNANDWTGSAWGEPKAASKPQVQAKTQPQSACQGGSCMSCENGVCRIRRRGR